ncbi:MAG: UDP-3-O-acyl-N-acetylglucosamine deacetylase [Methylocystis sp.]|nr:UDP-3-O-acyl-N-acetylglucosamine deacetylase [Methylocystis sp.]
MTSRQTATLQTAPAQTTLLGAATLRGVGAHSNRPACMTLSPASAGTGIVFLRSGAPVGAASLIEALWSHVASTRLRVEIGAGAGGSLSTIEHVMAALSGLGVDNALIEIDGPEVPAMDGSAGPFVAAILEAGITRLAAPRRLLKVVAPVRVAQGASWAELRPAPAGLHLDVEICFPDSPIGRQRRAIMLAPERFCAELAPARTFGFVGDVEALWKEGLAQGASLENTVAIAENRVLNPEGLRFADEFVRHKMLDVVGDLALAGAPIVGAFRSYRGGHRLNVALVEALLATPSAFATLGATPPRRATAADICVLRQAELGRSLGL